MNQCAPMSKRTGDTAFSLAHMNYLFLYVDTHYIVAAVRDNNDVVKPIRPKTEDEYFELFFREDTE